jgi:hypothetical protein
MTWTVANPHQNPWRPCPGICARLQLSRVQYQGNQWRPELAGSFAEYLFTMKKGWNQFIWRPGHGGRVRADSGIQLWNRLAVITF